MREKHNGQRLILAPTSGFLHAESAKISLGLTCVAWAGGHRHYVPEITHVQRRGRRAVSRQPGFGSAA